MLRRGVLVTAVAAALVAAVPAGAQQTQSQQSQSITATGTGQTRVHPKNRNSNASIVAAVDRARKVAVRSALKEAREYAESYAAATGMTLGNVISVSDQAANGFYGFGGPFLGPFGPNQYCGTFQQLIGRPAPGQRPKTRRVHRCIVPRFAYSTLTVTYAAS
jgi:uncharacterized protein YggE